MPQRRLMVEKVRMEKWDLHRDSGAKSSVFGSLLPSAQADPREAASYCPSPRTLRLPDQALVFGGSLEIKSLNLARYFVKSIPEVRSTLRCSIDTLLSSRGGSGWTLGEIPLQKGRLDIRDGLPGRWWSHRSRRCLRKDWTGWHWVP